MRRVDSLEDLETAFTEWRRSKRHPREAVPAALLERAQRAASVHGDTKVGRVTKLGRTRLWKRRLDKRGRRGRKASDQPSRPAFSRIDLTVPSTSGRPLAEVETPEGVKLRVFAETPEVLSLLSSVFDIGGRR